MHVETIGPATGLSGTPWRFETSQTPACGFLAYRVECNVGAWLVHNTPRIGIAADTSIKMSNPLRWVGAGRSDSQEPETAAERAVGDALQGRAAKLVVLFASEALDLERLITHAQRLAGDAPLVGCSTAGEIAGGGPGDGGVVALALGGDGFVITTAHVTGLAAAPREAGAEVAAALSKVAGAPHHLLMLLTDGLAGDQQEIVRGAYSVAGAGMPLVGGCAGDDLHMAATHQFFNGEVLQDAVVAVGIGSDAPLGIGVRHGWEAVGEPMLVTASRPNNVDTLDDQPALDVYLERLNAPAEARTDREAFIRFALEHPLGMARRAGEEQVRWIPSADFDSRSLVTSAEVPPGALVRLMVGDTASVLAATDEACADAVAGLAGEQPIGMLVFDCAARRAVLGQDGIATEIARVERYAAGAPLAGFYTYGEIARTRGVAGFHNQTLVVLAIA
jgi:hypothetical protein